MPTLSNYGRQAVLRSTAVLERRPSHAGHEPPDVDLTFASLNELAADITAEEGRDGPPFGSYVFMASDRGAALARYVEQSVFEESFGTSRPHHLAHLEPYEASSLFFCVIDHRRNLPVGSARVIVPNGVGLQSLDDMALWGQSVPDVLARNRLPLDESRAWDIATLAVLPGYRNRVVSSALHQAICTGTMFCGVDWLVSVLDTRVLRLLQAQLKGVFSLYEGVEPAVHAGSLCVPVWSDLIQYRQRLRDTQPALYETLFEGRHTEALVSAIRPGEVASAARSAGLRPSRQAGGRRAQALSGSDA